MPEPFNCVHLAPDSSRTETLVVERDVSTRLGGLADWLSTILLCQKHWKKFAGNVRNTATILAVLVATKFLKPIGVTQKDCLQQDRLKMCNIEQSADTTFVHAEERKSRQRNQM